MANTGVIVGSLAPVGDIAGQATQLCRCSRTRLSTRESPPLPGITLNRASTPQRCPALRTALRAPAQYLLRAFVINGATGASASQLSLRTDVCPAPTLPAQSYRRRDIASGPLLQTPAGPPWPDSFYRENRRRNHRTPARKPRGSC